MRIKIMEERSRMQLPDDVTVPPSLRQHRPLDPSEQKAIEVAADEFLFNQSRRRERVRHINQ